MNSNSTQRKNKYYITATAVSEYLPEHSQPDNFQYVFAYHVTIHNQGQLMAKLLSRHWVITDGRDELEEVKGMGVIGQQPEIQLGEQYRYTSGIILKTPFGHMHGSYQMLASDGTRFEIPIPAFSLATPNQIH